MLILKIVDGQPQPFSLRQLKEANSNISFPAAPSAELLASFDCFQYSRPERPSLDPLTQRYEDGAFAQDAFGIWSRGWTVVQKPQAEAEANVRAERDSRLTATDWRFRSDMNPSQAWIDYSQALRDVPAQAGFPYAVVWPTEPAS